ncbi:hypothetical protein EVJ58_g3950 [Rhodofomes roseus]|uniref:Ribosomal RNA methyltransferase FtsJ domain-containing protein n=1 Tax=Rhodofomes roseus TaxID=34475 RepID=A0A4Y9YKP9_9APHY|nr:hypothetical protein EVJ58_g3950 [Rhodofomes roseus]
MEPHTIIPDNFKNIAEVDDAVEEVLRRGISAEIVSDLTDFEIPFLDRSYDLRRLLALKHVAHRNSNVSREKKEQYERNRAAVQSDENSTLHLEGFKHAFSQINAGSGNAFGEDKVHSFLDLGCAPGGFSTWVLENNRSASGVGITLSPEARGLRLQLDSRFHAQFQCSFDDVCRIAAGDIDIASVPAAGFDLVIAQATIMFKDDVRWNESIGLVYAQLLVAFQHLAQGGSLITSLRSRPLNWIVDVFRALDITFESVHAVNTQYQGRRPFVYVVCRGFRADPDEKNNYIHRLRACIEYLDNSGNLFPRIQVYDITR